MTKYFIYMSYIIDVYYFNHILSNVLMYMLRHLTEVINLLTSDDEFVNKLKEKLELRIDDIKGMLVMT